VGLPETVQQPLIRDLGRIEVDLNRFAVVSEVMVGGVPLGPPGIADAGSNHTLDGPKLGIGPPESPQGEGGCFEPGWRRGIHRGG